MYEKKIAMTRNGNAKKKNKKKHARKEREDEIKSEGRLKIQTEMEERKNFVEERKKFDNAQTWPLFTRHSFS